MVHRGVGLKGCGCGAGPAPLAVVLLLLVVAACSTITESGTVDVPYPERIDRVGNDRVDVGVVALSRADAIAEFDADLARWGIQPVWLEVTNKTDRNYVLFPVSMDPEYFAPNEVAYMVEGRLTSRNPYAARAFDNDVRPGATNAGFIYVNRDAGVKLLNIELVTFGGAESFTVLQQVPGLQIDFEEVEVATRFTGIYGADERQPIADLEALRRMIEALPCCALGGDRETPGDPLNFVIVGDDDRLAKVLIRAGWHVTETATGSTAWATAISSLFGQRYPYSPVSPLYLYDRQHDAALQKSRGSVNERNHLRLWQSPYVYDGKSVWIGQISRDIGVRLSRRTVFTHKIDPDVDESRFALLQDLVATRALAAVGWVGGVGAAPPSAPRFNYTNDEYYTDGDRAVFVLSEEPVPLTDIEFLYGEVAGQAGP